MKKILFLVDNINRDFKSNALIARHLENNGWTVRLSGIGGNEYEIANQFRPDYIVVPKFNYDPVFQILWCLKGIKIILLDTEDFVYSLLALENLVLLLGLLELIKMQ